jgi:hypothetical protein
MRSPTDPAREPLASDESHEFHRSHEPHDPPATLAILLPGAAARVAGIASPSLRELLERLGVRSGAVVRCRSVTSTLVVLGVGSHVVAVPRAWAAAVYVSLLESHDQAVRPGGPMDTAISRDERTFAAGGHLLLG